MIGVGVDELVRRDAQRRARRMALVATSAVAGMAVMAVLTFMAVQGRNEAQSQRAQAEDLLEFMLGDLRKKLVPVGRLDVLDAVGGKALAYYGKQDAAALDANALGRRSRALHLIGEMREQRGQLEDALAAFKSAADTTGELLQRSPADGQRIFDHAQSVFWVGFVAFKRGQAEAAEKAFLEYRALAQRLVAIDPANVDWQLETAYANQNLGVVQLQRRNLDAALQSFSAKRDTLARLVTMRPALGNELAEGLGWIARVREVSGDYTAAIEAQQRRLEVLHATPGADRDSRIQRQVANVNVVLGHLYMLMGDTARAEKKIRAAVTAMETLVASDPANMFWLSELTLNRLRLAETERVLGKLESARALVDVAATDTAQLLQRDQSLRSHIDVRSFLLAQQTALTMSRGQEPPLADLADFVEAARRAEASGKVFTSEQAECVARVQLVLGDALAAAGRRDSAIEHWNAVVVRLEPEAETASDSVRTLLARTYLRLERSAQARKLLARVEASNYRHPAYADLVNEARRETGPGRATISRR
jgi:tetratricopeptide (TPR) repeat protein